MFTKHPCNFVLLYEVGPKGEAFGRKIRAFYELKIIFWGEFVEIPNSWGKFGPRIYIYDLGPAIAEGGSVKNALSGAFPLEPKLRTRLSGLGSPVLKEKKDHQAGKNG